MIQNLKELEKLLKLCRKQGVTEITLGGEVSFKLGELPKNASSAEEIEDVEEAISALESPLTSEEIAFFANGGNPSENPYRHVGEN